jgi:hypothetical protein
MFSALGVGGTTLYLLTAGAAPAVVTAGEATGRAPLPFAPLSITVTVVAWKDG